MNGYCSINVLADSAKQQLLTTCLAEGFLARPSALLPFSFSELASHQSDGLIQQSSDGNIVSSAAAGLLLLVVPLRRKLADASDGIGSWRSSIKRCSSLQQTFNSMIFLAVRR